MYFLHSPLEQFELLLLGKVLFFSNLNISFTNGTLYLLFSFLIFFLFLYFIRVNPKIIPNKWQTINEYIYDFSRTLVLENIGKKYKEYFPLIYFLFYFLLVTNLIGMVPYSFTNTSHLSMTLLLSLGLFIGLNFKGIEYKGINIFSLFLPTGSPLIISFFLIIIEVISYFARIFSLSIRLFANMMSGHSLLKILSGFAWTMLNKGGVWLIFGFIPVIIVFLVTGLEFAIAFLQAYVFTVLICIYISDVFESH